MEIAESARLKRNLQIDRVTLYRPFIVYTIIVIAMNTAVHMRGTPSLPQAAVFITAGLLTWSFYEYATHRWVLHRVPTRHGFNLPGNLTHLRHHANPDSLDRLTVQLHEGIPVCAVYCFLAWILTGSWESTTFLYTGFAVGYFFYEYLDFQAHHGRARNRWILYFRKNHLLHHHYDAKVRFGVTSPLFDYVFRTYRLGKRTRRTRGEQHHSVLTA